MVRPTQDPSTEKGNWAWASTPNQGAVYKWQLHAKGKLCLQWNLPEYISKLKGWLHAQQYTTNTRLTLWYFCRFLSYITLFGYFFILLVYYCFQYCVFIFVCIFCTFKNFLFAFFSKERDKNVMRLEGWGGRGEYGRSWGSIRDLRVPASPQGSSRMLNSKWRDWLKGTEGEWVLSYRHSSHVPLFFKKFSLIPQSFQFIYPHRYN